MMRSPFPGMNPYLEQPELWSAVHSRLIVAIADDLVDHLGQKYRVEVEKPTERYLASATNLVEIDLLRGGKPLPIEAEVLGDYRILVCRSNQRPMGDLYAFDIREPIPTIAVPLLPGEAEPSLALQKLMDYVFDQGRYHLAIDYQQPLQPQLSADDRAWVETLLGDNSGVIG